MIGLNAYYTVSMVSVVFLGRSSVSIFGISIFKLLLMA